MNSRNIQQYLIEELFEVNVFKTKWFEVLLENQALSPFLNLNI